MGGIIIGAAIMLSAGLSVWLRILFFLVPNSKALTVGWAVLPFALLTINQLTPEPTTPIQTKTLSSDPCLFQHTKSCERIQRTSDR